MNLLDVLLNVDQSPGNYSDVDPYLFSESVGLDDFVDWTLFNLHVKSYWVKHHYCTDSWCGVKAVYLNDELVGILEQEHRKSSVNIQYLSTACGDKMREFILENIDDTISYALISQVELDKEVNIQLGYGVDFTSELLLDTGFYRGKAVRACGDGDPGSYASTLLRIEFVNPEDAKAFPLLIECIEFPGTYIIDTVEFRMPYHLKK